MILTIQTFKLLNKLLKIQNPVITEFDEENNLYFVTSSNNLENTFYNSEFPVFYKTVSDENEILKTRLDEMEYLKENNYITYDDKVINITHHGYHCFQISFAKFCVFCFRSIAVPIVVAFVTTLITNHLWR